MMSRLDEILNELTAGKSSLDDACKSIAAAVRADSAGTRMWGMRIESRVTQQQLTPAMGRALLDAMETFEPEKTMWLAPGGSAATSKVVPKVASEDAHVAETSTADAAVNSNVLHALSTPRLSPRPTSPLFQDTEQLRAFLWDGPASAPAPQSVEPAGPLDNVAWLDTPAVKRVNPPRQMPGVAPVLPALELGSIVKGRYRLESHLGYGGIGQVFSAVDLEMERAAKADARVTLKLIAVDLKREPNALGAMQDAVRRVKALRHPNIVTTYDVVADNDRLFVVMEPLSGRWLGDLIRQARNTGVAHDLAWPLIEGIAEGLAHAHESNIVHSDLSPYAVFVSDDAKPKIMGFGLIHALPTSNEAMDLLDTMTLRAYSEAYTADTWATHTSAHPADDLYPLGVIAYELFTGTHPFQRHSLTTARQKQLTLQPIPGINRRASKLIARCLSFERKQWPHDAARFLSRMHGPALLRQLFGDRFSAQPASGGE